MRAEEKPPAVRAASSIVCLGKTSRTSASVVVKLKHAHESRQALTISLGNAFHGPLPADSLFRRPCLARLSAWDFIFWERALALAESVPAQIICYLAGVFLFFGLLALWLESLFWGLGELFSSGHNLLKLKNRYLSVKLPPRCGFPFG